MVDTATGRDLWIRRFHPEPQRACRVVCFPHAGGSASFYFPMSRALAPVADVLTMQYPGRQDRRLEPCIDDVPAYADAIAAALDPWTDKELVFFGHSLGAVLAYEVALRLRRRGVRLRRLFASGRRAPSTHREERVHEGDDAALVAEMRDLAATNAAVLGDPELLSMILPALRADYRAVETYRHTEGDSLDCPITMLTGDDDPKATTDEVRAWSRHTSAEVDLRVYPGGHFFLVDHQAEINKLIAAAVSG